MSFADAHGSGSSSVPAWAARATTTTNHGSAPSWAQTRGTEPLVPAFEFAPIKKEIQRDLKEIAKAADVLAKLAKKRGDADAAQRMLAVSSETRERARATSRKIRDAFDALAEGSSDRASLAALSAEFKATLNRFSEVAEMTAPAPAPAAAPPAGAVAVQIGVGAVEVQPPPLELAHQLVDSLGKAIGDLCRYRRGGRRTLAEGRVEA